MYLMIESLADGGVMSGLARDQALQLAAQTVYGSAAMVLQAAGDPGALMVRRGVHSNHVHVS